jgi:hypothetical protein
VTLMDFGKVMTVQRCMWSKPNLFLSRSKI